MTPKYRLFLVLLLSIFVFLGCDKIFFFQKAPVKEPKPKPPLGENVVAAIGNFYVTSRGLNKEIESYNSLVGAQGINQAKIDSKDKKITYLRNEVVRKYMLYQEALDRGLDKNEDIVSELESTRINLLVAELVRQEIKKIDVSSQEIEDFYNKNKGVLKEPEQRKIFEIVTRTEDEAKQVYIELLRGGDFASLAKQYSKSSSAADGGNLGFIALETEPQKRTKFDKFYEVSFAPSMEVGNISSIFKGPDGYYIIKLGGIKEAVTKPLFDLWENIKSWLLFEKQQQAIAALATKLAGETKVEIYEEKVE